MKTSVIVGIILSVIVGFTALTWYSTYSGALQDRVLIEASKKNLEGIFDNAYKKINQTTQVARFDRNSVKDIIIQHAQARTSEGGSLMKWVQESVPNVDSSTLKQLINVINGARDEYTQQQTYYNDRVRSYNAKLVTPFIGWILVNINKLTPIEYFVVSSTRTDEVFKTGKENDIDLGLGK